METEKRCAFYRNYGGPCVGRGSGHCEFDSTYSICDGEIKNCAKLDVLRRYLMGRSWMKTTLERPAEEGKEKRG